MNRLPIFVRFVAAWMNHKVNECIVPGRVLVGHLVPDNVDAMFGHNLGRIPKERFEGRALAGNCVINHKLEDVTAIGTNFS